MNADAAMMHCLSLHWGTIIVITELIIEAKLLHGGWAYWLFVHYAFS